MPRRKKTAEEPKAPDTAPEESAPASPGDSSADQSGETTAAAAEPGAEAPEITPIENATGPTGNVEPWDSEEIQNLQFGVRGRDDSGSFIRDENYKTLVRKDTAPESNAEPAVSCDAPTPAEQSEAANDNRCYDEGAAARRLSGPNSRSRCPYPAGSRERQSWKDGFDDEDEVQNKAA